MFSSAGYFASMVENTPILYENEFKYPLFFFLSQNRVM